MKNEYAFPSVPESGLGSTGMTMRDVFAAAVMDRAVESAARELMGRRGGDAVAFPELARLSAAVAYTFADAMLAEREKGADNDPDHRP